ncbi:MAG TPA: multidrug efflux SMR transporter [Methylocystis sp.]|nr:multidrug efflux SMR transporter [Methylocystis sp.]
MPWVYLSIAILSEVAATSALKASESFRHFWPSVAVVCGYGSAFYFLSLTQNAIPLGVSYAIWSGVGVALISLVGLVFYRQALGAGELVGLTLIIAGVVVLRAFSSGGG